MCQASGTQEAVVTLQVQASGTHQAVTLQVHRANSSSCESLQVKPCVHVAPAFMACLHPHYSLMHCRQWSR